MNRKIYLFILIILFGNTLVFADTSYQVKCVPNSTNHNDIVGCYIDEYKVVDNKLNTTYKQKMANLKKVVRKNFNDYNTFGLKREKLNV